MEKLKFCGKMKSQARFRFRMWIKQTVISNHIFNTVENRKAHEHHKQVGQGM